MIDPDPSVLKPDPSDKVFLSGRFRNRTRRRLNRFLTRHPDAVVFSAKNASVSGSQKIGVRTGSGTNRESYEQAANMMARSLRPKEPTGQHGPMTFAQCVLDAGRWQNSQTMKCLGVSSGFVLGKHHESGKTREMG